MMTRGRSLGCASRLVGTLRVVVLVLMLVMVVGKGIATVMVAAIVAVMMLEEWMGVERCRPRRRRLKVRLSFDRVVMDSW